MSRSPCAPMQCSSTTRLVVAHLAMLFACTAFSVWNVLGSVITETYCAPGDDINCPVVFAFYREVGAAPILLVTCAFSRGFERLATRRDVAMVLGAGFALFGIQLLGILGIAWTNADVTAFYQPANPVAVVLLAFLLGMERYRCSVGSVLKLLGVLITVSGIVLIVLDGEEKCQDLNATACAPVRANKELCNGTLMRVGHWDGGGGGGDGGGGEVPFTLATVVNASTECCRTCESTGESDLFAIGNVFLASSIVCSALYTIFQKQLVDPATRSSGRRRCRCGGSGHTGHADGRASSGGGSSGTDPESAKTVSAGVATAAPPAHQERTRGAGREAQQQDMGGPAPPAEKGAVAYRTITIITYAYGIAAVCMAGLAAILRPPAHLFAISGAEAGAVVYAVVVCSVVSYLLMCYALGDMSASVSSLYGALQPPITAIIAWFWQGQTIGPLMIGGGLLGILGLVLTSVCSDEAKKDGCGPQRPCARAPTSTGTAKARTIGGGGGGAAATGAAPEDDGRERQLVDPLLPT